MSAFRRWFGQCVLAYGLKGGLFVKDRALVPRRMPWTRRASGLVVALLALMAVAIALVPAVGRADESAPAPIYKTLDELNGKRFAYVNGSVYNQNIQERLQGTKEDFYPSLAECVAAVEAGKEDAAVQLSYCCRLAVNRRPGTVALLPEPVADVSEGYFFPKGSPLKAKFNELIDRFGADGTLAALEEKWVAADESGKTLPKQDWDAPNGTLKFATSGVIEPFSYVGEGGVPKGYDVELALLIARELGYHLDVSTIPMDSIFASVASGKADFGGTLTETPERAAACDFSKTVMPTTISVIVESEAGSANKGSVIVRLKDSFYKTFIEEHRWQLILSGLSVTVLISVCAGGLGLLLGYLSVLARRSGVRWIGAIVDGYQALMGGVPRSCPSSPSRSPSAPRRAPPCGLPWTPSTTSRRRRGGRSATTAGRCSTRSSSPRRASSSRRSSWGSSSPS